ncbi:MAG: hypothetical protein Q4F15_02625 [Bacillota bacterium]|nr:hypothetical protein [Bacillota bacterium]
MIPEQTRFALIIFAIVALPVILSCLIILGRLSYQAAKRGLEKYSLLNHFPFEMMSQGQSGSIYLKALLGIYLLCSAASTYFLMDLFIASRTSMFYLALSVALIHFAEEVVLLFLFIIPASYHKQHILLTSIYFSLMALCAAMGGLYLWNLDNGAYTGAFYLALILFLLAAIRVLTMLSPKFGDWARMESKPTEDGDLAITRPKLFILAFSEWATIICDCLSVMLTLLGLALYLA